MTRHRRTIIYLALALAVGGAASLLVALLLPQPADTIATAAGCAAAAVGLIGLVVTVNTVITDDIKPGDHIYHSTGDYLGVCTRTTDHVIHFSGPRKRDGLPVTFAGRTEVYKGKAPETNERADQ